MHPDARHTLYIECLLARELGMGNVAMQTALTYVAHLGAGKPAKVFRYIPDYKGNLNLSYDSKFHPRAHLSLQYLVRNYFRVERVIAVRLAKSVSNLLQ
eukprot:6551953-Pyramimonas_sp.AAC.1